MTVLTRLIYAALLIVGTFLPWSYFYAWFDENGWSLAAMIDAWYVNDATSGLVYDLTIAARTDGLRSGRVTVPVGPMGRAGRARDRKAAAWFPLTRTSPASLSSTTGLSNRRPHADPGRR
jgi:hypothetical protein